VQLDDQIGCKPDILLAVYCVGFFLSVQVFHALAGGYVQIGQQGRYVGVVDAKDGHF